MIWTLKDIRKYCEAHPLTGVKIQSEDEQAFNWVIPGFSIELINFDGTFNSMERGDEMILQDESNVVKFSGVIDEIDFDRTNEMVTISVINHAIKLKDNPLKGLFEYDATTHQPTGNIIREGNELSLAEVMNTLGSTMLYDAPGGAVTYQKLFKLDVAAATLYKHTPFNTYGCLAPWIFKDSDGKLVYWKVPKNTDKANPGDYYFALLENNQIPVFVIGTFKYIARRESGPLYASYNVYLMENLTITKCSAIILVDYQTKIPPISPATTWPGGQIDAAIADLNTQVPLADGYIHRHLFSVVQIEDEYYYAIKDSKKSNGKDYYSFGDWRLWLGKIYSILDAISFKYTNANMVDLLKDMAILTNSVWWVDKGLHDTNPVLHFYPRELVIHTFDIQSYRSKITDIKENIFLRKFDTELSDNVLVSDIVKSQIKKYYQDQSGEYVKTTITLFAREIGDTYGVAFMDDLYYGPYLIGRVETIEYVDETTTVVTCYKQKSAGTKRWWE